MEKDIKNDLSQKLDYLGLDLENIPEFLYDFKPLNFNLSRLNNDKDHKVFKFVSIDKIDILITPCLRSDTVKEKYSKSAPLGAYLINEETEEGYEKSTTFLKMLNDFNISDVQNIINIQNEMSDKEPFRIAYNKEHLWHIYYSESTDRYFMMVCTKESTFAEFFYLLKKKIEIGNNPSNSKDNQIFVPINYVNYSEKFLDRDALVDIENYLWLFTKNWPSIYEVYNKSNEMSISIIGETFVYDTIKSTYKIKLSSESEAVKFYKTIKAIFIMQTEIKNYFLFSTKVNSKHELEIYNKNVKIEYENLAEFIKTNYEIARTKIEEQNKNCIELEKELEKVKTETSNQELLYLEKQKEIGTFLECKKTFSGRVKYFFKSRKNKSKIEKENLNLDENLNKKVDTNEVLVDLTPINTYMEDKVFYTIEDLVVIYSMLEKCMKKSIDLEQDIKAMTLKLENFKRKVSNAENYIKEIDEHKKSFFDFLKFTKKDEILSLDEGEKNDSVINKQIKKVFNLEMDFENLGVKMDKLQRKKLSKEEMDSIFVANSKIIDVLNSLKKGNMNESEIKTSFKLLKEEYNQNKLIFDEENFDIFGNVADDNRKTKYIGSRSHRENERSKYKILNINRNIDEFDFTEKLQLVVNYLEEAILKVTSEFDMPLYKLIPITDKIDKNEFLVMNIDAENEFEFYEEKEEGALNLIKINFKEKMPILYYTNIIYFDNINQTLPEGMDLSKQVLIDTSKFNLKLVNQTKFRTNNYFRESNNLILPKSKDIFVYEYDVEQI